VVWGWNWNTSGKSSKAIEYALGCVAVKIGLILTYLGKLASGYVLDSRLPT